MKGEPTAVAIVLELVFARTQRMLAARDYHAAQTESINLDMLVRELMVAEQAARHRTII